MRYIPLILIILLSACAHTPILERENIRYIKVSDAVEVVEEPLFDRSPFGKSTGGRGSSAGHPVGAALEFVFGAINALYDMTRPKVSLRDYIEKKNIDVGHLAKSELVRQLRDNDAIVLVSDNERYDALLTINIAQYGVDSRKPFFGGRKYAPYIDIVITMTDPGQRWVLWEQNSVVSADTPGVQGYKKKVYFSESPYMQNSFKQAAEVVIEDAIRPLFQK